MPRLDYYSILQVARHADAEVIEAAYRRLARKYHPDLHPGAEATERMKRLNEAYDTLSDPTKRTLYDRELDGHQDVGTGGARPGGTRPMWHGTQPPRRGKKPPRSRGNPSPAAHLITR